MMKDVCLLGLLALAGVLTGFGDEIIFKSGDRLTGKVVKLDAGKLVFKSDVAGKLKLKTAIIKTLSTEAPIELVLLDGTVQTQQVAVAEQDGHVLIPDGKGGGPVPIAFDEMAKINPERPHWKGSVTAGATLSRGNTKSNAANISMEATKRTERDRISLGAGYYFANQRNNTTRDDHTTVDNWFVKGQYDYFFRKKLYGYGNIRYEKNRVTSLERRVSPGMGVGWQLVEQEDLNISSETGASWLYEQYSDPAETRTYLAGRFAYHIDKAFNEKVSGFHNTEYFPSLERVDSFLVNTDIGLRSALTSCLAVEAKAQMAYNSQPSENRENKDLRYLLGLNLTF